MSSVPNRAGDVLPLPDILRELWTLAAGHKMGPQSTHPDGFGTNEFSHLPPRASCP